MPYIARTNGGDKVLELRVGTLDSVPKLDRRNWRRVTEKRAELSPGQTWGAPSVIYDGGLVVMLYDPVNVAPPGGELVSKLLAYTANLRWEKQQSPLHLPNGMIIDAAESSKAKIDQALTVLEKGWTTSIDFKGMNGWITVDLAMMTFVAQAMVAREQALFSAEKIVAEQIEGGVLKTFEDINNWAWPT